MARKGEGGPLELVDSYGKVLLAILIVIILLVVFITYINSHPELGVSLPPLFGGEGGTE